MQKYGGVWQWVWWLLDSAHALNQVEWSYFIRFINNNKKNKVLSVGIRHTSSNESYADNIRIKTSHRTVLGMKIDKTSHANQTAVYELR